MIIPPLLFLGVVLGITAVACVVASVMRLSTAGKLAALARQWQMRYAPEDPFGLSAQVAARLTIPGAADVLVRDLIYSQDAEQFRYYFVIEYTMGVLRKRRRCAIVGTIAESRQRSGWEQYSDLKLARGDGHFVQQFESLKAEVDNAAGNTE